MIFAEMIDFSKLQTPPEHGDVLIMPAADQWTRAAHENHELLGTSHPISVQGDLAIWRRDARQSIFGVDDTLVFVLGHQPEFIHPGVWAKHVVAMRAAAAADGIAVNVVVDSDAPKKTSIVVPSVQGDHAALDRIPVGNHGSGCAYEQMTPPSKREFADSVQAIQMAMGDRFGDSQMSTYLEVLADSKVGDDWVDRLVAARRAVERSFGIEVRDIRISDVWYSPLLLDMLFRSGLFASSYNQALATYRREHRVRGAQRPIPDLQIDGERVELPIWAMIGTEPRSRLFVETRGDDLLLFADRAIITDIPLRELQPGEGLLRLRSRLGEWKLRPRALALTLWARLLLADLFIHGIGGAKYDRISDSILADYYGVTPPHMACVSATLHLDLPQPPSELEDFANLGRALRDLSFNPQRNLPLEEDLVPLFSERERAVQRSLLLREKDPANRSARRDAFRQIRDINQAVLNLRPSAIGEKEAELNRAILDRQQYEIIHARGYFFGLYDQVRLNALLDALPNEQAFRV